MTNTSIGVLLYQVINGSKYYCLVERKDSYAYQLLIDRIKRNKRISKNQLKKYLLSCTKEEFYKFIKLYPEYNIDISLGNWIEDKIILSFPKGKAEKNETKIETAKRELYEEVPLIRNILNKLSFSNYYNVYKYHAKDNNQYYYYYLYEAEIPDKYYYNINKVFLIQKNTEVKSIRWISENTNVIEKYAGKLII